MNVNINKEANQEEESSTKNKISNNQPQLLPQQQSATIITINLDNSPQVSLEINVNNVVCSYSTKCHLNLRKIALQGLHVEYKKENGMVNMKLRKPYTTATIWSSGKITCAGAKTENDAYVAARRYCRLLQKMQFKVKMTNYRVVNVLATCTLPFNIDILKVSQAFRKECSYEPELHPGATFKLKDFKTTLKLFTTGSITVTSPSVDYIQKAINYIYPILLDYKHISSIESSALDSKVNNISIANETNTSTSNQENGATKPDIQAQITPVLSALSSINNSINCSMQNGQMNTPSTIINSLNANSNTSFNGSNSNYNSIYSHYNLQNNYLSSNSNTLNQNSNHIAHSFFDHHQTSYIPLPSLFSANNTDNHHLASTTNGLGLYNSTNVSSGPILASQTSSVTNSTPNPTPHHWFTSPYDNLLIDNVNVDDFLP